MIALFVLVALFAGFRRTTWRVPTIISAAELVASAATMAYMKAEGWPAWLAQDAMQKMPGNIVLIWVFWGIGRGIAAAVSKARQPTAS